MSPIFHETKRKEKIEPASEGRLKKRGHMKRNKNIGSSGSKVAAMDMETQLYAGFVLDSPLSSIIPYISRVLTVLTRCVPSSGLTRHRYGSEVEDVCCKIAFAAYPFFPVDAVSLTCDRCFQLASPILSTGRDCYHSSSITRPECGRRELANIKLLNACYRR